MTHTKIDKNEQLWRRINILQTRGEFSTSLALLRRKYKFLKKPTSLVRLSHFTSDKELKAYRKRVVAYRKSALEKLEPQTRKKFLNDIQKIVNKFNLGQEWQKTILDNLLCHSILPPAFDLHLSVEKRNGRQSIVLELGPETTLQDLTKVFPKIKKLQAKLYPNYKRYNYSRDFDENLRIYIEDRQALGFPDKLDYAKIRTKELKDIEIAARIFPDAKDISVKADKRRANKIKQLRRRLPR